MTNSCRLCWNCTNQCLPFVLFFFSFLSLPIILTVDQIVRVNMHSFLPCFSNMHSALIQENDTFHRSHWLFLVWGENALSLRWLSCTAWLLGCFMCCPWKDPLLHFHPFCVGWGGGGLQPRLFGYPWVCSAHHLQSSGAGLFGVTSLFVCHAASSAVFCASGTKIVLTWH